MVAVSVVSMTTTVQNSNSKTRPETSLVGYVKDNHCGLEHMEGMGDDKSCTLMCVKNGKFVLVDREHKHVYQLDKPGQEKAREFAGQKVKVTGRLTGKTIRNPVCGMTVDPKSAAGSFDHKRHTYYFCSTHCLNTFRDDPERFTNESSQPATHPIAIQPGPTQTLQAKDSVAYTCPMHPEVREPKAGSCPKCGMALEPVTVTAPKEKIEYTCPMHPQIIRDAPGFCPICGMAVEPRTVTQEEDNAELSDMRRRFWVSTALTLPLLVLAMSEFLPGDQLRTFVGAKAVTWISLALASPVVLWGGWPFFVRGWYSIVNRSLNMFTLIGLGVAVAYVYSVIATAFPQVFPSSFRDHMGNVRRGSTQRMRMK
jgi:Cu+-exporting ATPase